MSMDGLLYILQLTGNSLQGYQAQVADLQQINQDLQRQNASLTERVNELDTRLMDMEVELVHSQNPPSMTLVSDPDGDLSYLNARYPSLDDVTDPIEVEREGDIPAPVEPKPKKARASRAKESS